jgi:hypothetical protein
MLKKISVWYSSLPFKKYINMFMGICTVIGTAFSIIGYYSPPNTSSKTQEKVTESKDIVESFPGVSIVGTRYEREPSSNSEAELEIRQLADEWSTTGPKIQVKGLALYGTDPQLHQGGPNIGDIDFVTSIQNNRIRYSEEFGNGRTYKMEINFNQDGLEVKEDTPPGRFGMNVTFAGSYHRVGDIKEVVNHHRDQSTRTR